MGIASVSISQKEPNDVFTFQQTGIFAQGKFLCVLIVTHGKTAWNQEGVPFASLSRAKRRICFRGYLDLGRFNKGGRRKELFPRIFVDFVTPPPLAAPLWFIFDSVNRQDASQQEICLVSSLSLPSFIWPPNFWVTEIVQARFREVHLGYRGKRGQVCLEVNNPFLGIDQNFVTALRV